MHPRLLTDRHDGFQLGKLINAESDRNLIVSVGAEQILEHRNAADHRNASVGILCALVIIENTVNKISPFRMNAETVDVALCSTAVTDQKDMLQILACFTHLAEDLVDCHTEQEVNTRNKNKLEIILTEDARLIDEVVVVGYGSVKKRDLTGAVTSVKSAEVLAAPTNNVMEALQGKIPGMDITKTSGQVGGDVTILLRGSRSIYGSNEPLFIIDGIPGSYSQVSPSDIESVDVLKDASSTAIYGSCLLYTSDAADE